MYLNNGVQCFHTGQGPVALFPTSFSFERGKEVTITALCVHYLSIPRGNRLRLRLNKLPQIPSLPKGCLSPGLAGSPGCFSRTVSLRRSPRFYSLALISLHSVFNYHTYYRLYGNYSQSPLLNLLPSVLLGCVAVWPWWDFSGILPKLPWPAWRWPVRRGRERSSRADDKGKETK